MSRCWRCGSFRLTLALAIAAGGAVGDLVYFRLGYALSRRVGLEHPKRSGDVTRGEGEAEFGVLPRALVRREVWCLNGVHPVIHLPQSLTACAREARCRGSVW